MLQNLMPEVIFDQFSVTPSAVTQSKLAQVGKLEPQYGGFWAYIADIFVRVQQTIDQPSSGGTLIPIENLARVVTKAKLKSHVLGDFFSEDINGPLLKELVEPMCAGYRDRIGVALYGSSASGVGDIPATDGDTVRDLTITLPFWDERGERPEDCCPPTVCFRPTDDLELQFAASSVYDAISTGCVTKTAYAVTVGAHLVLSRKLYVPSKRQWKVLSGKGQKMQLQLGACGDLWALGNRFGLGGPRAVNNYLTLSLPKGEVASAFPVEQHLERFFLRSGLGIDAAEWLYGGTPPGNGLYNTANAIALPIINEPYRGALRSQIANLGGAVNVNVTQTTADDSLLLASEYEPWSEEMVAKVADAFGLKPGQYSHRPKLARPPRDGAILPGKTRYLPRELVLARG